MKRTEITEFCAKDFELLSKPLPYNPCQVCVEGADCTVGTACCGCNDGRRFDELVQPLKDANLLEYALLIQKLRDNLSAIERLIQDSKDTAKRIPEEVITNTSGIKELVKKATGNMEVVKQMNVF